MRRRREGGGVGADAGCVCDVVDSVSARPFVAKVDQIVKGLHADGTLRKLSIKDFYGKDYATKAGQFDMSVVHQVVK